MSGKNRAFALAVATAALVGLSAPVASAASFSGPSGFNNDSIINISGNQLPTQACNDTLPTNTTGTQTLATGLAGALGIQSSGATSAAQDSSCTQNPSATITSSVTSSN